MLKKFRFHLVILVLAIVIIILLPSVPALEDINATPNNATAKNIELNDMMLNSTIKNNMTSNAVSINNNTNRSAPIKDSSILYTPSIANGTDIGQVINATGHARYSFKLGSLDSQTTHKPVKDLERVVFICNIM
ncbi:Uncharacterised protein [uncultured archaeon]|nr:Uncharacterised protein [uncultured archaeon]